LCVQRLLLLRTSAACSTREVTHGLWISTLQLPSPVRLSVCSVLAVELAQGAASAWGLVGLPARHPVVIFVIFFFTQHSSTTQRNARHTLSSNIRPPAPATTTQRSRERGGCEPTPAVFSHVSELDGSVVLAASPDPESLYEPYPSSPRHHRCLCRPRCCR
jgi:hypothetical protein